MSQLLCYLTSCRFRGDARGFFRFPSNELQLQKWKESLELTGEAKLKASARICFQHFQSDHLLPSYKNGKLSKVNKWKGKPSVIGDILTL